MSLGTESNGALQLVVITDEGIRLHALPAAGSVTLGRAEDCDVRIDHPSVSRRHAVLRVGAASELEGSAILIEDLGSANGTFVAPSRLRSSGGDTVDTRLVARKPATIGLGERVSVGAIGIVVRRELAFTGAIVRDDAMAKIYALATRIGQGSISVLILGETGVGKEVLARHVHASSQRAKGPFLALNCAALSDTLLESELFGHEKGAFTGATSAKPGLLESAEGGTVFLDELGELPPSTQVKLLRVLEERKVLRVGSVTPRSIDVRLVSATHRDLEAAATAGTFRSDLYFRLNGVSLLIPPLRERGAEIEAFARSFADQFAMQLGRTSPELSRDAAAALKAHRWPGNIRELRNVMERAVLLCDGDVIEVGHLALRAANDTPPKPPGPDQLPARPQDLRSELASLERKRIVDALAQCGGNQTQAAALLGMPRRTLVLRMGEYQIPRPRKGDG